MKKMRCVHSLLRKKNINMCLSLHELCIRKQLFVVKLYCFCYYRENDTGSLRRKLNSLFSFEASTKVFRKQILCQCILRIAWKKHIFCIQSPCNSTWSFNQHQFETRIFRSTIVFNAIATNELLQVLVVQEKYCASAFVGEWKLPTGFIVEVLNFTASVTLKN